MFGVNTRVVWSIVKRDLRMYFTNPSGYVFITLFIFLSAAAAFWQDRFFLNNLANLDQLNELIPYLLVFFVPALTMAIWSEERKQGTDELLLTLPATDFEISLGKYLAAVTIYAASLALSLSHVVVLMWLGSPDLGLMLSNYLGYLLLGVALIAAGMVASLLTANTTVAFILGAIICALLVWGDAVVGLFSEGLGRSLTSLSPLTHFGDFARGVVRLKGMVYFASLAGFFVYLNVLLLGRRHWPREADGLRMGLHQTIRAVTLGVALLAINVMVGRTATRVDLTAERLHSLSPATARLLADLDPDRPVFIQAFVSPDVPESFVQTRANLLGILAEIDAEAGPRVQVLIEETEPYTETARAARERFGITPRQVPNVKSARAGFSDVFLGIAVTCGAAEQVTPFLDRGLPVEYELVRAIRVVAKTERKTIGVVNNDLKLFGGLDFTTMRNSPVWSVVGELEKQYEVVQIGAQSPIVDDLDGLLVVLPSLLPQPQMDNVLARIESGTPTLLLIDPLPIVNPGMAPSEQAGGNRNPFTSQGQPPPTPKGDIDRFVSRLGIRWSKGQIVWDSYNPHPDLAHLPEEVVFVGEGSQAEQPFDRDSRASNALQELVLLYPGHVEPLVDSSFTFTPLVTSGRVSGRFDYQQVVRRSIFGTSIEQRLRHEPDAESYVLAAHITGTAGGEADDESVEADAETPSGIQLIAIADVDFISEQFFAIRRAAPGNLSFDNVTFFLNAMDVLVGDDSFIDLRNRRVAHRTLARVEDRTSDFIERRAGEEQEAEAEADKALADAQQRLNDKVAEVRNRADLDAQAKAIMARNLEEVENRRLEVLKANIEATKEAKIQRSREDMEAQVRNIQSGIRTSAVLIPPIPVFVLGVLIFIRRQRRERAGAAAAHRLRSES